MDQRIQPDGPEFIKHSLIISMDEGQRRATGPNGTKSIVIILKRLFLDITEFERRITCKIIISLSWFKEIKVIIVGWFARLNDT